MTTNPIIRRALISVSDKTGIAEFAKALADHGVELISTGGTARTLRDDGLTVLDVADVTGFPEMLDGRVKTLHPMIHGGLLGIRGNADHAAAMEAHGIQGIDLIAINLYPFEETIARGADFTEAIENIDIGGPAMIRAAAKNHDGVAVLTDPDDYASVLSEMAANGGSTLLDTRKTLAAKAYARTAAYDAAISNWFAAQLGEAAPKHYTLPGTLRQTLRYGENPHQSAAFYVSPQNGRVRPGVATARQLQGKELSYNNFNDTDAAYELVAEFDPADSAAVVIVKHANPCGVAIAESPGEAYQRALRCDPVSAFGGIIALNHVLDADTAQAISEIFTEVIIAPDATPEAQAILTKKKNLRLLLAGGLPDPAESGATLLAVTHDYELLPRFDRVIDFKVFQQPPGVTT